MNNFPHKLPANHSSCLGKPRDNTPVEGVVPDKGIDLDLYMQLIHELQETNQLLEESQGQIEGENKRLKDRVKYLKQKIKKLKSQGNVLPLEAHQSHERIQQLNVKINSMRGQILLESEKRGAIQERIESVALQGVNLGNQFNQIKENEEHLPSKIEDIHEKYKTLKEHTDQLEQDDEKLKEQNEYLHRRCKRLEEESSKSFISKVCEISHQLLYRENYPKFKITCSIDTMQDLSDTGVQPKLEIPTIEITLMRPLSSWKLSSFDRFENRILPKCMQSIAEALESKHNLPQFGEGNSKNLPKDEWYQSWPKEALLNYLQAELETEEFCDPMVPFSVWKIGGDKSRLTEEAAWSSLCRVDRLVEITEAHKYFDSRFRYDHTDLHEIEKYPEASLQLSFFLNCLNFLMPISEGLSRQWELSQHLKLVLYKSMTVKDIPVQHFLPAFFLAQEGDRLRVKKIDEAFLDLKNMLQA